MCKSFEISKRGTENEAENPITELPETIKIAEKKSGANGKLRDKPKAPPLKFKALNPSDESPFLNYLLFKLKPSQKKNETWISRITSKFSVAIKEEGEQGEVGYTRTKEKEEMVMLDECGCERKAMVEEDGWKTSTHLPQHWMFKYSHQEKSTRVDIISHSGDIFNQI